MGAFRVTVRGDGIRVTFNETVTSCGFYKNVYLWAGHADEAGKKARAVVLESLRDNPGINQEDVTTVQLEVDEVERVGVTSLFRKQGFVFYPRTPEEA